MPGNGTVMFLFISSVAPNPRLLLRVVMAVGEDYNGCVFVYTYNPY